MNSSVRPCAKPQASGAAVSLVCCLATAVAAGDPAMHWEAQPPIIPEPSGATAYFGERVALFGSLALIGDTRAASTVPDAGAAFLVDLESSQFLYRLVGPDGDINTTFGDALALSANQIVVGDPLARHADERRGAAYVFDVQSGELQYRLVPADLGSIDRFGYAAAIDDIHVVVSAPLAFNVSADGVIYIFDAATGEQLDKVYSPPDGNPGFFGSSLVLREGILGVGAPGWSHSVGRLFTVDIDTGAINQHFATAPRYGGRMGDAVAMNHTFIIGGGAGNRYYTDDPGYAMVHDVATGNVVHTLESSRGANYDRYGQSVALNDDNLALIGAPDEHADHGVDGGAAYFVELNTGETLLRLTPSRWSPQADFGESVALNEEWALVGAPYSHSPISVGSVYVYRRVPRELRIQTSDPCPGTIRVKASNATPGGRVALGASLTTGTHVAWPGVCEGSILDISPPWIQGTPVIASADASGVARFFIRVPQAWCDDLHMQAIDTATCHVSNLLMLN